MSGREVQSIPYLLRYGKAATGATRGPAADDARKHPGVAPCADDHNSARAEFVDCLAGERGRTAFGNPLGAGDELVARDFAQVVKLFIESRLRPAGIFERAVVLRTHHQHRI